MSSVDPGQMDIEALRAKIRGGSPLTPAERAVAQRPSLNTSTTIPKADPMVTGLVEEALAHPQPDAPPTGGFVRHDDLVAWVDEVLTTWLAKLSARQDAFEAKLAELGAISANAAWAKQAYAELQEAFGEHTKLLEVLDVETGQKIVDRAREEADRAAAVVEEANARSEAVEQHLVGHDTRLDELAAELDRRVPQEPESSPEP